jgi:hypothetical protein
MLKFLLFKSNPVEETACNQMWIVLKKGGICVGLHAQKAIDQIRQNASYAEMLTKT